MEPTLREIVTIAARRPDVRAAVGRVYADLQARIDERRPVCTASGRCCRFDEYGHRLYVTTIELATFVGQLPVVSCQLPAKAEEDTRGVRLAVFPSRYREPPPPSPLTTNNQQLATSSCPFQLGGLCGVHAIRPFGCRMFFCDPTSTAWQNEAYEEFHAEMKRLHAQLGVPYRYVEWRQALGELGIGVSEAAKSE